MNLTETEGALEAILFAAGEPVAVARLAEAIRQDVPTTEGILERLAEFYEENNRGIRLIRLEDKAQLATSTVYGEIIRAVLETRRSPTLSPAALEVLSIAAYRQPVTRMAIEAIRGADSMYTLNSLVEKGILEECGRLDAAGRPILYRTTDLFLRVFGLSSLDDLPPLPDEENAQLSLLERGEEDAADQT